MPCPSRDPTSSTTGHGVSARSSLPADAYRPVAPVGGRQHRGLTRATRPAWRVWPPLCAGCPLSSGRHLSTHACHQRNGTLFWGQRLSRAGASVVVAPEADNLADRESRVRSEESKTILRRDTTNPPGAWSRMSCMNSPSTGSPGQRPVDPAVYGVARKVLRDPAKSEEVAHCNFALAGGPAPRDDLIRMRDCMGIT